MSELFNSFYIFVMNTIDALGVYGPLLGCVFIILESIERFGVENNKKILVFIILCLCAFILLKSKSKNIKIK